MNWNQTIVGSAVTGFVTAVALAATYTALKTDATKAVFEKAKSRITGDELVSVIVPTLNEQHYLRTLLASIRNQSYESIEIIVVDCSEGEEAEAEIEICKAYDAYYIESPRGVSYQRNLGAQSAEGSILVFADADCIMHHNYIERLVKKLQQGAILAHGVVPFHRNRRLSMTSIPTRVWFKPRTRTIAASIAIRPEHFWKIGGFNEACGLSSANCYADLEFGEKAVEMYGRGAIQIDRDAVISTDPRREEVAGLLTSHDNGMGVRNGQAIEYTF